MDLADIKICKTLIINVFYFVDSLNSYSFEHKLYFQIDVSSNRFTWLFLPNYRYFQL